MEELLEAFDFFGCYLLEETALSSEDAQRAGANAHSGAKHEPPSDTAEPSTVCDLRDSRGRVTHVAHIDARGAKPREWLRELPTL